MSFIIQFSIQLHYAKLVKIRIDCEPFLIRLQRIDYRPLSIEEEIRGLMKDNYTSCDSRLYSMIVSGSMHF